jgi:UDP-N-acetyl-2-amino-2-deoxyglucuronate dehydrogenase
MAKKDKLRFGVIGVGGMGFGHVNTCLKSPVAELVAICDIDLDIAEGRRAEVEADVPIYADYKEMIEKEDLDAVALGTPHYLHAPMTIYAADHGLHVLTEKPMAVSVAECDAMIEACSRNGVKLGVGHQRRWSGWMRGMRRVINDGTLGRPTRFSYSKASVRNEAYYASGEWRGTWAQEGGGALINQFVHDLDVLCYLMGPPAEVMAYSANWGHANEVDDLNLVIVRFVSGWVGTISLSLCSAGGNGGSPNVWEGDTAVLRDNQIAQRNMGCAKFIAESPEHKPDLGEWEDVEPEALEEEGRDFYYRNFLNTVNGEETFEGSGEECRWAIELDNAVFLSQLTGRRVELPLDRDEVTTMFADLAAKRKALPRMR